MDFKERLFELRRQAGLSQEELAHLLGLTRQAVQKWEAGTSRPDMDNLAALADYFHVSLDYLTGREGACPLPRRSGNTPRPPPPSSTTTTTRAGTTNIKVSTPCSACPWFTSTSAAEITGPGGLSPSATSPPGSWPWAALPRACSPWEP